MAILHIKSPNGTQTNVDLNNVGNPIGSVQAFAGSTIPTGWLLCDGSAVSRTTYAALFAAIGTTYGDGNGSTTFNLPNLTDRFIQGSGTVGTVKEAGLPNIEGQISPANGILPVGVEQGNGPFLPITWVDYVVNFPNGQPVRQYWRDIYFNASRANSIYGNSTTVQPPALTMCYIIKY